MKPEAVHEVWAGSAKESAAKQGLRAVPDCKAIGHGSSTGGRQMVTNGDMRAASGNVGDVLNLFASNVILPIYSLARNFAGVYPMCMQAGWGIGDYQAKDKLGNIADVVSVCNQSKALVLDNFMAYWCPYGKDDCRSVFLGDGADYMFTAKMDGCTFGVGSQTPTGVHVAHANLGGKGAEQISQLKGLAELKDDKGLKYLGPAAYRYSYCPPNTTSGTGTEATTFGVRVGPGKWKFFSQVVLINKSTKTMQILDMIPIG